jgi:predicted enzyme related to lactoylglutathione lyase
VTYPNTYIFVDLPSPDPAATATFYGEVFGWKVEGRPEGVFHRAVPGGEFLLSDGSPSGVGNLHIGIYGTRTPIPNPNSGAGSEGRSAPGPGVRVYVLVSDDDSEERILDKAEELGAEILWRGWYWKEFNGFHGAFLDPWGNEIVLWTKGGDAPEVAEGRQVDDLFAPQ